MIRDNQYISGDNISMSPALFAYFYASEKLSIPEDKIKFVSIGATNEIPGKIDFNLSLAKWAYKLTSINSSVKKHT